MEINSLAKRLTIDTLDLSVCVFAHYRIYQLESIYKELTALLNERGASYEVIVLANPEDEASREDLAHFQERFAKESGRLKIFVLHRGMLKASALKAVEKHLNGKCVLTLETGGKFNPKDAERLLTKISDGFDLVNSVRNWQGEPFVNRWQVALFNWVTRKLTGSRLHDLNSTMKVFRRGVLESLPLYGDLYRFLPILAERRGFKVTDVTVSYREEQKHVTVYGLPSYIHRLLDIMNLIFLTRFTEKPLRFFGGLGMGLSLTGLAVTATLAYEKLFMHESLRGRPLLLLGILLIVVGVQTVSIGLIGEIIIYSRTADFKTEEIEMIV